MWPRARATPPPARHLRVSDVVKPDGATYSLPSVVRTRVLVAGKGCTLEQVDWLSPYTAETIGQAAWRAGPGARLEVIVPKSATDANLAAVQQLFGWLGEREIVVTVQRGTDDE